MNPAQHYAPESTFMERVGLDLLRQRSERRHSRIQRWSQDQLRKIEDTERSAVRRAAWTGAVSGTLLAGAEITLRMLFVDDADTDTWREQLPFWIAYMAVIVVVSGAEIGYLYWIVLQAVAHLSTTAGLGLGRSELEQVIARGMTRAALDFPNPHEPIYGIDPYARVPRVRLLLYAAAYRLKVGATSFVLRVGVRRIMARAAVRFLVPFLAVPVFAVWNGLIVRWVMRSARLRAAGAVMVKELDAFLEARREQLGERCRRLMMGAVEEAILRSCDAHPSYVLMLASLFERLDLSPDTSRPSWSTVLEELGGLSADEQHALLTVLLVTVMIDGRLRRSETDLLEEAYQACGHSFERLALQEPYRCFKDGQGLGDLLDEPSGFDRPLVLRRST